MGRERAARAYGALLAAASTYSVTYATLAVVSAVIGLPPVNPLPSPRT